MKKFLIFLLPLFFLSCSQMDNSSTVGLVLSSKSLRAASNIELESNAITVSASLKGEVSRQIQKKVSDFSKDTVIVFDSVPAGKNIYVYVSIDQVLEYNENGEPAYSEPLYYGKSPAFTVKSGENTVSVNLKSSRDSVFYGSFDENASGSGENADSPMNINAIFDEINESNIRSASIYINSSYIELDAAKILPEKTYDFISGESDYLCYVYLTEESVPYVQMYQALSSVSLKNSKGTPCNFNLYPESVTEFDLSLKNNVCAVIENSPSLTVNFDGEYNSYYENEPFLKAAAKNTGKDCKISVVLGDNLKQKAEVVQTLDADSSYYTFKLKPVSSGGNGEQSQNPGGSTGENTGENTGGNTENQPSVDIDMSGPVALFNGLETSQFEVSYAVLRDIYSSSDSISGSNIFDSSTMAANGFFEDIAVDSSGNVYSLFSFSSSSTSAYSVIYSEWGEDSYKSSEKYDISNPPTSISQIEKGSDGNIYILYFQDNIGIGKLTLAGTNATYEKVFDFSTAELSNCCTFTVDEDGNFYVIYLGSDLSTYIAKFDSSGNIKLKTKIDSDLSFNDIFYTNGTLFASAQGSNYSGGSMFRITTSDNEFSVQKDNADVYNPVKIVSIIPGYLVIADSGKDSGGNLHSRLCLYNESTGTLDTEFDTAVSFINIQ